MYDQGQDMRKKKIIANNKKARHDFFIEEVYEAGIVLTGTEIKSIRQGKVNLRDSFARIDQGEVYLYNMHISPYDKGNRFNVDPLRTRKLLLNRQEIRKLIGLTTQKGLTLVPINLYINEQGRAKMEIAVARGKKLYDKREDIAKRDSDRKIRQKMRQAERGDRSLE
jgi:SsrA-binding protein